MPRIESLFAGKIFTEIVKNNLETELNGITFTQETEFVTFKKHLIQKIVSSSKLYNFGNLNSLLKLVSVDAAAEGTAYFQDAGFRSIGL